MEENEDTLQSSQITPTLTQETVILVSSAIQREAQEKGEVKLDVIPLEKFKAGEIPSKKFSFIITLAGAAIIDTELTATLKPGPDVSGKDKQDEFGQTILTLAPENLLNQPPLKEEFAQTIHSYTVDRSDTSVVKELKTLLPTHETVQGDVQSSNIHVDSNVIVTIEEIERTDDQNKPESTVKDDASETSDHFISAPETTDDEAEKALEIIALDQDTSAIDTTKSIEGTVNVKDEEQKDVDLSEKPTESLTMESKTEQKSIDKLEEKETEKNWPEPSIQSVGQIEEIKKSLTGPSIESTDQKSIEEEMEKEKQPVEEIFTATVVPDVAALQTDKQMMEETLIDYPPAIPEQEFEKKTQSKPVTSLSYPEVSTEAGNELRKLFCTPEKNEVEVPTKAADEPVTSITLTGKDFTIVDIRSVAVPNSESISNSIHMAWAGGDLSIVDVNITKSSKSSTELKIESWTPALPLSEKKPTTEIETSKISTESPGVANSNYPDEEPFRPTVFSHDEKGEEHGSVEKEVQTDITLGALLTSDSIASVEDDYEIADLINATPPLPQDPAFNPVSGNEMKNLKTASQIFEQAWKLGGGLKDPTEWGPELIDSMLIQVPWKEVFVLFDEVEKLPMWDTDLLIQPNEMEYVYVRDFETVKSSTSLPDLKIPSVESEQLEEHEHDNLQIPDWPTVNENAQTNDYYLPMGPAISQLSTLTGILAKRSPALINIPIDPETWGFPSATFDRYGVRKEEFFAAPSEIIPFDLLPKVQSYLAIEDDEISTVFNPSAKPQDEKFSSPLVDASSPVFQSPADIPVFVIIKMDVDSGETRIRLATGKSTEKETNFAIQYESSKTTNELGFKSFMDALQFCSAQMEGTRKENFDTELVLQSLKHLNMKRSLALRFDNSCTTGDESFPVFRSGLMNKFQLPDCIPDSAVITSLNFHFEPRENEFLSSQTFLIESCKKGLRTTLSFNFKTKTTTESFINPVIDGEVTHCLICDTIKSSEGTSSIGPDKSPITIAIPLGTTGKGLMKLCAEPAPVYFKNRPFAKLRLQDIGMVDDDAIVYKVFAEGQEKSEIKRFQSGDPSVTIRIPIERRVIQNVPPSQLQILDLDTKNKLNDLKIDTTPLVTGEPKDVSTVDAGRDIDVTLEVWRDGIKEYEENLEISSVDVPQIPLFDDANYDISVSLNFGPCIVNQQEETKTFTIDMSSEPTTINVYNMNATIEVIPGGKHETGFLMDKVIACEPDMCPADSRMKYVVEYNVLKDDELLDEILEEMGTDESPFTIVIPLESEDAESFVRDIVEGNIEVQITCEVTIDGKLVSGSDPCLKSPFIFDIPFEDETEAQIRLQIRPLEEAYKSDLSPFKDEGTPKSPKEFSNLNQKWIENLPRMEGGETAVGIPCATVIKDSSDNEEHINGIPHDAQLENIQMEENKTYGENFTQLEAVQNADVVATLAAEPDNIKKVDLVIADNIENTNIVPLRDEAGHNLKSNTEDEKLNLDITVSLVPRVEGSCSCYKCRGINATIEIIADILPEMSAIDNTVQHDSKLSALVPSDHPKGCICSHCSCEIAESSKNEMKREQNDDRKEVIEPQFEKVTTNVVGKDVSIVDPISIDCICPYCSCLPGGSTYKEIMKDQNTEDNVEAETGKVSGDIQNTDLTTRVSSSCKCSVCTCPPEMSTDVKIEQDKGDNEDMTTHPEMKKPEDETNLERTSALPDNCICEHCTCEDREESITSVHHTESCPCESCVCHPPTTNLEHKVEALTGMEGRVSDLTPEQNIEESLGVNLTSKGILSPSGRLRANVEYMHPIDKGDISISKVVAAGKSPMRIEIPLGTRGRYGTLIISTQLFYENLTFREIPNLPQEKVISKSSHGIKEEEKETRTIQYCTEMYAIENEDYEKSFISQYTNNLADGKPNIQHTRLSEKNHVSSSLEIIENIRSVCEKEIVPLLRKLNNLGRTIRNLDISGTPYINGIFLDTRFGSNQRVSEGIKSLPFQFAQHGVSVQPNFTRGKIPNTYSSAERPHLAHCRAGNSNRSSCLNVLTGMDSDNIIYSDSVELNQTLYEPYFEYSRLEHGERNITNNNEENYFVLENQKKTEHTNMSTPVKEENKFERTCSNNMSLGDTDSISQTEIKHIPVTSAIYPPPIAMFIPFHDEPEDIKEEIIHSNCCTPKAPSTSSDVRYEKHRSSPRPQTCPLTSQYKKYNKLERVTLPSVDIKANAPTASYPTSTLHSRNRNWSLYNEQIYPDFLASRQPFVGGGVIKPTTNGIILHSVPNKTFECYRRTNFGLTNHRLGVYNRGVSSPHYNTRIAGSQKKYYY